MIFLFYELHVKNIDGSVVKCINDNNQKHEILQEGEVFVGDVSDHY